MAQLWTHADPLGDALHFLRMSGVFYTHSEFTAPWGLELPPLPNCLMFHVVTAGQCLLEVESHDAQMLQPGDFALVPHGEGHRLLSQAGVHTPNIFELHREHISDQYEILRHGRGGERTVMICGAVRMDHPAARHLLDLLPAQIVIRAWQSPQMDWMQSTLRLMAAETERMQPGGVAVITRLADILVIQAVRHWMASDASSQAGWLGALQDEQIGRALMQIHHKPERSWTVEMLATEAAMSRSAFAARFNSLVGEPPMQYVRRWRMYTALTWLKEEHAPLGEVSSRLGYQSEAAFSRAFKQIIGISPGAARRKGGLKR